MAEAGPVCGCGEPLREWTYDNGRRTERLWCVDLADLLAYRRAQPTRHDVVGASAEQLRQGSCQQGGVADAEDTNDG